ncbi:hypothetical protein BH20GEM2_BH20GEM2_05040 [soil metagenome]
MTPEEQRRFQQLRERLLKPWAMRAYLAAKLPLALFAGVRVRALTERRCEVSVPYGWRSTNPFRSTYFAAQAMAAEMSTGLPALLAVRSSDVPVSMLVVEMWATYEKKATATATFTCDQVAELFAAVRGAREGGEPTVAQVDTVGRLPDGTIVASFTFTWSFKRKQERA